MSTTIDQAFVKQFETEVHLAYQRMGSKLRGTVRTSNVTGSTARFQKIGTGAATTKSRHGDVTPMNLTHSYVEVTMADYYAPEYIDKLDELKININERQAVAESSAAALGRKTDELIIAAMDAGANSTQIHDTSSAVEKADLLSVFETFGTADVPDDNMRFIAMSPAGFTDLFLIDEFASSDYVGPSNLPFQVGMSMKPFLGFNIFGTSAVAGGKNFCYHMRAVGLGINADVSTEINYVPQKAAHLLNSSMSMGAKVIDDNGVYELLDNN